MKLIDEAPSSQWKLIKRQEKEKMVDSKMKINHPRPFGATS